MVLLCVAYWQGSACAVPSLNWCLFAVAKGSICVAWNGHYVSVQLVYMWVCACIYSVPLHASDAKGLLHREQRQ